MRAWPSLCLLLLLCGCREAAAPYSVDDYGERSDSALVQLTWNSNTDQAPVWSPGGDSIYYSAVSFPGLGINSGGVLLGVPREGGTARVILPALQVGTSQPRYFTAPAFSADGQRVAFFDLTLAALPACDSLRCSVAADTAHTQPLLARGQLRVRRTDSSGADEGSVDIAFRGRSYDPLRALPTGLTLLEDLPFQHRFTEFRQPTFRPAWSPDNTRIVFSDGERLLLWQPGSAPVPIAGTEDGVWPAWSPDGQWIAFTRLARGVAQTISCQCVLIRNGLTTTIEVQERILHSGRRAPGVIVLIRPDGSGRRDLGEGDAPAWMPDNNSLIVVRAQALWRLPVDGSAGELLPNTQSASSPAVSPDGRYLAFARLRQGLDWNIWVLRMDANR